MEVENDNDSLSAVERFYPDWWLNPWFFHKMVTLENQLKRPDGAKVDQEILRTLLMKLLLSPTMAVARALCQSLVSSSHDYESVCNSLLIIFRHNKQDMRLVEWALQTEIETCEGGTTATLFRGMTVGVKLVSIYLHIKGHFFLKGVLQPLIAQMQTTSAIEVDPMKLADLSQLQDNQKRLIESVEQMFLAMESAIDLFPCALKRVFQKAHQMVEERFNEKGYQLIGGFFFLRFVCPALVSPERVGLASTLSNETRRSLILISKVLQNASNDVQFGEKEQYMVFINEWIALKQERMHRFLSQLSTAPSDVEAHPAPPGTEKMSTEEERRMAVRALVNSFDTHKEQMSAALAGHKEQLLFDRLIQVVDPADLLAVENVTLNFTKVFRTSLGEIEVKRTPDAYGGRKSKDKKKDKEKESKEKEKEKEKESKEKKKWNSREDIKVVGKGRWRRHNRPVSDFIHHEELASFSNAMRHATTTEATRTLESQIAVLKEQLAAEREVRSKVETQLAIARSHLAQEAVRREALERLAGAMLEKLKSAGIAFSPPAPAPSSPPTPAAASHSSHHHPIPTLSSSPPSPAPSGAKSSATQVYALSRHNSSPNRLVSKAPPTGSAAQQQQGAGGTSSPHSLSPLSQTKAPHTSPREQHAKVSPRSSRQATSTTTTSGQQQSSSTTTTTAVASGSASAPITAVPRVRQSSGGGSLIASAYQNSGRPLMAVDDAQSGKSLTDRLVEKMFSADSGLELRETRDGRLCFCGCECVDWLVEELRVGRDKAVAIGDKLLQRGFFRCLVYDAASFTDDHTLFQATTPVDTGSDD